MEPVVLPGLDSEMLDGYIAALILLLGVVGLAAFKLKVGEKSIAVVKRILSKF